MMKIARVPTIPENLTAESKISQEKNLQPSGKARGDNLGSDKYDFKHTGVYSSHEDVAEALKHNSKSTGDSLGSDTSHWINYYYSHRYNEFRFALYAQFNIYPKHWHALAVINYPDLKPETRFNLMKESSLVLAYALNDQNCNLSKEQWEIITKSPSFKELFYNSKKMKKNIVVRFTELGNQESDDFSSDSCINYKELKLEFLDLPPLLFTANFSDAYSSLSKKNQINLREALKENATKDFVDFTSFISTFELNENEYDSITSQLENNTEEGEEEQKSRQRTRALNIMLCNVQDSQFPVFIQFLNSLTPNNKIAVLTSNRLKLSAGNTDQQICIQILRNKDFKKDHFSVEQVLQIIKNLEYNRDSVYNWDNNTFTANFNNEHFRHDIEDLLSLTHMVFFREHQKVIDTVIQKESAESNFMVELLQYSNTFNQIISGCIAKRDYELEQAKSNPNHRRYFRIVKPLNFDLNNTGDEKIELTPVSSSQKLEIAEELLKKRRWTQAAQIIIGAWDNSEDKLSLTEKLTELVISKAIIKYYQTIENYISKTIDIELSKSELEISTGVESAIDTKRLVTLDYRRNEINQDSTQLNKKLLTELKHKTCYYEYLQTETAIQCLSILADTWEIVIADEKPGTERWIDSMQWHFKASQKSVERNVTISAALKVKHYTTPHIDRSSRLNDSVHLNKEEETVTKSIFLRIMMLVGERPNMEHILNGSLPVNEVMEKIDDCFRFETRNHQGELINKVVYQRIRNLILNSLRKYTILNFDSQHIATQQKQRLNSMIFNEFQRFLGPIRIEWEFIKFIAEYASNTKTEISHYSRNDINSLFVKSCNDKAKAQDLLTKAFKGKNIIEMDSQCAESYLDLISKHKLTEFNNIISNNIEEMLKQIGSEGNQNAIEMRNNVALVEFEFMLPNIDLVLAFKHLEKLKFLLKSYTNGIIQSQYSSDFIANKTNESLYQCWTKMSEIYAKHPGKAPLHDALECERYRILFNNKTNMQYEKNYRNPILNNRYISEKDPTEARDLIYTRLARVHNDFQYYQQASLSVDINTIYRARDWCFYQIYYKYNTRLSTFFQQDKGPYLLEQVKRDLKENVEREKELLSKSIAPIEMKDNDLINTLIACVFVRTETYQTLLIMRKIHSKMEQGQPYAKEYCELIRERLTLCKTRRNRDVNKLRGQLLTLSKRPNVSVQHITKQLTSLLNSNKTEKNGFLQWGQNSALWKFIKQQLSQVASLEEETHEFGPDFAVTVATNAKDISTQQTSSAEPSAPPVFSDAQQKDMQATMLSGMEDIKTTRSNQEEKVADNKSSNNQAGAPLTRPANLTTRNNNFMFTDHPENNKKDDGNKVKKPMLAFELA